MPETVKLKVCWVSPDSLTPYAQNAKLHPDSQIEQIADSIRVFGFNEPIAVDADNVIIAGHGRLLAAQKLGLDKVPVIYLSHLTPEQRRAYALAANKLVMNSGFDTALLTLELTALQDSELDVSLTGFSLAELTTLLPDDPANLDDPDVPESFPNFDDSLHTDYQCPKCGFEWSGKPAG